MAATFFSVFRAKYYSWRSDWLEMLGDWHPGVLNSSALWVGSYWSIPSTAHYRAENWQWDYFSMVGSMRTVHNPSSFVLRLSIYLFMYFLFCKLAFRVVEKEKLPAYIAKTLRLIKTKQTNEQNYGCNNVLKERRKICHHLSRANQWVYNKTGLVWHTLMFLHQSSTVNQYRHWPPYLSCLLSLLFLELQWFDTLTTLFAILHWGGSSHRHVDEEN